MKCKKKEKPPPSLPEGRSLICLAGIFAALAYQALLSY